MAARFWVNGGVDNLWGTIGNWSLTSGGAGGQAVPTSSDDVTIDSASGHAMTLNTSARVCKSLTTTAIQQITFDQQLSVSGSITLVAGQTFAGATTNKLRMVASGTWTTHGVTIPQDIEIGGAASITPTLADALTTSGNLTLTCTTGTSFSGSFTLTCVNCTISGTQTVISPGNVVCSGILTISDDTILNGAGETWTCAGLVLTGDINSGSSTDGIIMTGGTWSGAGKVGVPQLTLAGDITISGTVHVDDGVTLLYSSGTITTTGSTLQIDDTVTPSTIHSGTISWNNVTVAGANSAPTFNDALTVTGTFTVSGSAANITFSAAATVGTLSISVSCTLDALSCTTCNITAAATITLDGLLTVNGVMSFPNAALTWAGAAGFTAQTWQNTALTATRVTTFHSTNTYRCTVRLNPLNGNNSTIRHTWSASTASSAAFIILSSGATQDLGFVDPTDMDASLGITIVTYHGTIVRSPNWRTEVPTVSGADNAARLVGSALVGV